MAALPGTDILNGKYLEPPIVDNLYNGGVPACSNVDYPALVIPLMDGSAGSETFAETITARHATLSVIIRNNFLIGGEGAPIMLTEVQAKMAASDDWFNIVNSGEGNDAWNRGVYPVIVCGERNPQYLNYEEDSWFILDVSAFYAVRFRVSSEYLGADTQFAMSTLLKNGKGGTYTPTTVTLA